MNELEQHIRESNLVEGIDDVAEDKRSLRAWAWLEKQPDLVPSVILELHRRITLKQLPKSESGHYRKIQVWVGNHTPPPPFLVEQLVYDWCMDMQFEEMQGTPKEMHVRFETVHPFVDGNGRTGRMLMWWHELKHGKRPTLILNSQKQDYYKWFAPTPAQEVGDE